MKRNILLRGYVGFLIVVCCWMLAPAPHAWAHPLNNGYSQITIEGRKVGYELFLPEQSLLAFDTNGDKRLTADELAAQQSRLAAYLQQGLKLESAGAPLQFHYDAGHADNKEGFPGITFLLTYTSDYTVEHLTIHYNLLFDDADPQHVNFAVIMNGADLDQAVFDAADRSYDYAALGGDGGSSLAGTLLQYVWLGMTHIWTGYDHLLFLLSLLVVCAGWRDALRIVTSFTVAHSVTLALAATGTIQVNAQWVEFGIALTIAYVAADNWFVRWRSGARRYRWLLTLGFGLVHGFGFAGALQEIGLPAHAFLASLLCFNGGVELGQIAVLAVALPVLMRWKGRAWYPRFVGALSVVVFALAVVWAVERAGWVRL